MLPTATRGTFSPGAANQQILNRLVKYVRRGYHDPSLSASGRTSMHLVCDDTMLRLGLSATGDSALHHAGCCCRWWGFGGPPVTGRLTPAVGQWGSLEAVKPDKDCLQELIFGQ